MEVLYSVETVDLAWQKKLPPNIIVTASGTASSGGWSDFALSQHVHIQPPADGVQEFTLVGRPPAGPATEALAPGKIAVAVLHDVDEANYWGEGLPLNGVRVHAASNKIECKLDQAVIEDKAA